MDTERVAAALAGRYRIERRLGEGGMATVFLANDLKHDRHVALKVLKPELAAVLGAERFIQEIKTTANLQHPHILPLFDSGRTGGAAGADDFLYYVMPYIEGETLRQKLTRETQLGIEESVRVAREVADALDYAHRHGVIHRDIKPENILIQDGRALVADFGIALAVSAAAGGRMTETGLSLGTPHYMSPEQATAEKELTARSDVYSLGSVLYEMLSGEPPHTGASAQAVIMKIVTDAARPVTELRKSVPSNVAAAVAKSLEKLAADRFESARAFSDALANPGFATAGTALRATASPEADARWKRIALGFAALGTAAAVVAGIALLNRGDGGAASGPALSATIELPADVALDYQSLRFSPDGTRLFAVVRKGGVRSVYERRLDSFEGRIIPGTEEAYYPAASPDGQWLLFRAGNRGLFKSPLAGGPPVRVDPLGNIIGVGAWGPDGTLFYARNYKSGLWRLRPGASEPEVLTTPDPATGELGHWSPQLLPDGQHLLFNAFRTPVDSARIEVLDLKSGGRKLVLRGGVSPVYANGYLVFARSGTLFAAAFDTDRLEVTGEPVPVLVDVAMRQTEGAAGYAISQTGALAYVPSTDFDAPSSLVWVDRSGRESPALSQASDYDTPALSPDGQRVALALEARGESQDIWVIDFTRGSRTRITSGGGADFGAVWTPDGRSLVYISEQPIYDLFTRAADASAPARPFLTTKYDKYPGSFSPDGRELVFHHSMVPYAQIWRVGVDGRDSALVLAGEAELANPALSPDGKWLVIESSESGREEVSVVPYPNVGEGRHAASTEGGTEPRWTRGGRELVWRNGRQVVSAPFNAQTGEVGQPRSLFVGDYLTTEFGRSWDLTADGERFLFMKRPAERAPRRIMLVTNWIQQLGEKVGRKP